MTTIALKLNSTIAAPKSAARPGPRRWTLGRRLEMAGVLSLIGSSAAYAVFTLCHLA